tara:strand:+ start:14113 stop:14610 length:498 start_codon:yes stop_codon:yes gene_type:complete
MKKDKKNTKKNTSSNKNKINKELKDRVSELENKNLRLLADFDNLKKRKNQEVQNLLKFSGERIIKDLLPIFDDLDRLSSQSNKIDGEVFQNGIKLMSDKLVKVLSDHNIEKFNALGEVFDSNMHDAMMVQKSNKKKNLIIDEFEKGYKYHDKIIRHSKVIVSKGK